MKANLIKDEEDLDDLHPKKTVLNVKSKNFKTKHGKKNQKALNKLTSKTPLVEPEEDLDTESSDDDHSSEVDLLTIYSDSEESDWAGSKGRRWRGWVSPIDKEEPISDERRLAILLGDIF